MASSTATAAAAKSARMLLVLDLNGCLMTRLNHQELNAAKRSGFPLPTKIGHVAKKPVFMRPHAVEFVRYVQAMPELDVAVWTSATAKNAATLIDMVLGAKTYNQFKFVWGREKCTPVQDEETPWATIKDLGAIYKSFPHYSPERTLIVDDSLYKARLNAANALVLPSFDLVTPRTSPLDDTVLLDLGAYLRLLVRSNPDDVRQFIHAHPFSLLVQAAAPAVTSTPVAAAGSPAGTPAPAPKGRAPSPARATGIPPTLHVVTNSDPGFAAPPGYVPPHHAADQLAGDMSADPGAATMPEVSGSWIDLMATAKDAGVHMDADDEDFWEEVSKVSLVSSEASSETPSGASSPRMGPPLAPCAPAGDPSAAKFGSGGKAKAKPREPKAPRKLDWSDL